MLKHYRPEATKVSEQEYVINHLNYELSNKISEKLKNNIRSYVYNITDREKYIIDNDIKYTISFNIVIDNYEWVSSNDNIYYIIKFSVYSSELKRSTYIPISNSYEIMSNYLFDSSNKNCFTYDTSCILDYFKNNFLDDYIDSRYYEGDFEIFSENENFFLLNFSFWRKK